MPPRGGGGGGPRALTWERGTIAQVNEYGLKLENDDDWRNWSQYGLKPAERPTLTSGQKVKVGMDTSGYIREITGPNDEPLQAGAAQPNGGGGRKFTEQDSWRMTVLSCLSSAVQWVPTQPDEIQLAMRENRADKEHPLTPSQAVYRVAIVWATKAWNEPVPKVPQPQPAPPAQPESAQ